ncbi:MAG: family N-acetyltransferase [Gammaproteobacteria bacterium]|jgi:predicted GNAT family N-acyltransferase|nr:family N-acetyltransferase [Gammaproteobacteria bacterium]
MIDKNNNFQYEIIHLNKTHNKKSFSCGIGALDNYLLTQASQDNKKNVAVTYVLTLCHSHQVLGYYTLSSLGIMPDELPGDMIKKLPRYPILPAVLLGRLAIDKNHQGNKIGKFLLIDALKRSFMVSEQIGAIAVIVNAKNKIAADFYKHFGFIEFPENNLKLFLLMDTIKMLFFK